MSMEDMKKIANAALAVADDIFVEADNLRVFCHRVINAIESPVDDFERITLSGDKAKVTYLALKARLVELAESIPTKVPEEPPVGP